MPEVAQNLCRWTIAEPWQKGQSHKGDEHSDYARKAGWTLAHHMFWLTACKLRVKRWMVEVEPLSDTRDNVSQRR